MQFNPLEMPAVKSPKYLAPTRARARRAPQRFGAARSMKRAPRLVPPCRDNSGANPPVQQVVPETKAGVSAACGWQLPKRRDNQMAAQPCNKPESVKRLHTAKRMILLLPCRNQFVSSFGNGRSRTNRDPHFQRTLPNRINSQRGKSDMPCWSRYFPRIFERNSKIHRIVIG